MYRIFTINHQDKTVSISEACELNAERIDLELWMRVKGDLGVKADKETVP